MPSRRPDREPTSYLDLLVVGTVLLVATALATLVEPVASFPALRSTLLHVAGVLLGLNVVTGVVVLAVHWKGRGK